LDLWNLVLEKNTGWFIKRILFEKFLFNRKARQDGKTLRAQRKKTMTRHKIQIRKHNNY